jgi:prepilin-type processing-associated H-X9-DG protein
VIARPHDVLTGAISSPASMPGSAERCRVRQASGVDERYQPADIDVAREEGVTVTFLDGHVAAFGLEQLRLGCPCATCRGLRDQGQVPWPRPGSPAPLRITDASLHGAWGLAITWNDGHATGIFPFESLRRWSEGDAPYPPDSGLGA